MYQEKGRIIENVNLGEEIFMMRIESPKIAREARPGQFAMLAVTPGVDPLLRRPLSFHDADATTYVLLYKAVGRGTSILKAKSPGDEIDSLGPLGSEFEVAGGEAVLVAGGIGIAPLHFLGRSLAAQGRKATLIYGSRTAASLVRAEELESLGLSVNLATEDGSRGFEGTAVELFKQHLSNSTPSAVYACGPTAMLKGVMEACAHGKVQKCQVSIEERMACGVGACLGCSVARTGGGYLTVCKDGPVFNAGEIKI
jgi:dihydroorotate dehydrogenase electron transfer subunit